MKKHLFLLSFILMSSAIFAEIKVETFSTTSNTVTYNPTPVSRLCAQATWTVYLGGILTNVGNFGSTNFAAPLRARTTTEQAANANFAYLVSDSISGGVDSLWFNWNSNGSEIGRTWNIRISVNGVPVGTITSAATAQIALGGPFNLYKVGGLKRSGKFVIKIENLSNASGTGNEYRFVVDNLSWTTYVAPGEKNTPNLTFASSGITKLVSESDFTNALTNSSDGIPVYSSSNESCATIDSNTGQVHITGIGNATITASVPETTNFKAGSATYVISIKPTNWKIETFTNISSVCIVNPSATACSTTPVTDLMDNSVNWTYWLGGGNTAIFGSNAMYIRARYSTETAYDYGYIKSDSISGGLTGLSFQWNQGGAEDGLTYNVAVIVNNDTIGFINDAGLSASFLTPKTFSVQNLAYSGKVVIKLENRTPYTGTSNKGRIVLDNLEWYGYTAPVVTSIVESNKNNKFIIAPTATSDLINISTTEKQYTVKLYNYLGSLVYSGQNTTVLSVRNFSAGLYFVELYPNGTNKEVYKIIKSN